MLIYKGNTELYALNLEIHVVYGPVDVDLRQRVCSEGLKFAITPRKSIGKLPKDDSSVKSSRSK